MLLIPTFKSSATTVFKFCRYLLLIEICIAQLNRPPDFVSDGDMSWLTIKEDLPIGSSVYTLMAVDPEGSQITYNIINSYFMVDTRSGVVTLAKALDREDKDVIDVIITATDEKIADIPANTVEIARQITVLDANDNAPLFKNATYNISVIEDTEVGTIIFTDLIVSDADIGINAEISLHCQSSISPLACDKFDVEAKQISSGQYQAHIRLKKKLDFEEISMYIMTIRAEDSSPKNHRFLNVIIEVIDSQDSPPVFVNSPYFLKVSKNISDCCDLLKIDVFDGDRGKPRPLDFELINLTGYFNMTVMSTSDFKYVLSVTASQQFFDSEFESLKRTNQFYEIFLKAVEIEDGHLTSTYSETSIKILTIDTTSTSPKWSKELCSLTISKNTLPGVYLDDCILFLSGEENFEISLKSIDESNEVFEIERNQSQGTTQVLLRLKNSVAITNDYYNFQIIAMGEGGWSSSVDILVKIVEENSKGASFEHQHYSVNVSENSAPETFVTQITVSNADSEVNKNITYSLEGFGSHWFTVISNAGIIKVADCGYSSCLDYEKISNYFFVLTASSEVGKISATSLLINIIDVNDNLPIFKNKQLFYNVLPDMHVFDPPLILQATDADSSFDGNNIINYKIVNVTPPCDAFSIDRAGEIKFNSSALTSNFRDINRFTIDVVAEDEGTPLLTAEARVIITIKKKFEDEMFYFTQSFYNATILETDVKGKEIIQVSVINPIPEHQNITYRFKNGFVDNFDVDSFTGVITIAANSLLDLDLASNYYNLQLEAVDLTKSRNHSAVTVVGITVEDVNNKAPKFLQSYYLHKLNADITVGSEILTVVAEDSDANSFVQYFLKEIRSARDHNGFLISDDNLISLKNIFYINAFNGTITMLSEIDLAAYSRIVLSVYAQDLNAVESEEQITQVDVFLIIQRKKSFSPTFPHPWTVNNPQLFYNVPEEAPIGSKLLTLTARCFDGLSNITYEKLEDYNDHFTIDRFTGVVQLKNRLDYEFLPVGSKSVSFIVSAINNFNNEQYSSNATVVVDIIDINDNSPIFLNDSFWRLVPESIIYPEVILTVSAIDHDQQYGFGEVFYTLTSDSDADFFEIDSKTGDIRLAKEKQLDREKKAVYNLRATAIDNPDGIENHRRSSVLIVIELLDVNDNYPEFSEPLYQAIFPETVAPDFVIRHIEANDADIGDNSIIRYSIGEDSQLIDYIDINETSGHLFVKKALSGKGQSEPYKVVVTAADRGEPSLSTDVLVLLFITDISANDEIPVITKPLPEDVVYLSENSPSGTIVTTLEVSKEDTLKLESGKVRFSFLGDGGPESDEKHFAIDSIKGIVTARYPLDREMQVNYTIVIMVKDVDNPSNHNCLLLNINLVDVDDHFPLFQRPMNYHSIFMEVFEESTLNTVVGYIESFDEDEDENAAANYIILDGQSQKGKPEFAIKRTADNRGMIYVNNRIDCETKDSYLLTVQVKRWNSDINNSDKVAANAQKANVAHYDPSNFNLVQIRIDIKDVDDHQPYFIHGNTSTWIKSSSKLGEVVFHFIAKDDDFSKNAILYNIKSIHFSNKDLSDHSTVFKLNRHTGVLRLWKPVILYENGYFEVGVEAKSNDKIANCILKIYVIQSKQLLKLVLDRPVVTLKDDLNKLKVGLQESLISESSILTDVIDVPFVNEETYANFSSVCFQFVKEHHEANSNSADELLDILNNPNLESLYKRLGIQKIEKCEADGRLYTMNWIDLTILVIASIIVIVSLICCFIICYMYKSSQ